jgi:predicted dehydrogenase
MRTKRAAVIGLGHQAEEDHIPGLLDSDNAELVAICDIQQNMIDKFQKTNARNIHGYVDFKEMMDQENLDFVVVATPHYAHTEIVKEAIGRGIHVMKEKPFARNLKEAMELKNYSEEKNINIMTTLQRRFNPIYTSFLQLKEQIGKPFFVESKYTLSVQNPHEGWRGDKEQAGGGCIIDMGYHIVDLLVWYFGLPDSVTAEFSTNAKPNQEYDAEDTASILFSYEKQNLFGNLILSRFSPPKTEYLNLLGSRGHVELKRGEICRYRCDGNVSEKLTRENAWPSAATAQIDYFCNVLDGKKENIGSPAYHLQHVAFIEACYKSKSEGVKINPMDLVKNAS